MRKQTMFEISGLVLDAATGQPSPGLRVLAFDKDFLTEDDFLGEGLTGRDGRFRIAYGESEFVKSRLEAMAEGGPDLVLQVLDTQGRRLAAARPRRGASRFENYVIRIELPGSEPISLDSLFAGEQLPKSVREKLRRHDLSRPADLLTVRGLKLLREAGLDEERRADLQERAKFAVAGAGEQLSRTLREAGIRHLAALARMSPVRAAKLSETMEDAERRQFGRLRAKAEVLNRALTNSVIELNAARGDAASWLETETGKVKDGYLGGLIGVIADLEIILPFPEKEENCAVCRDCEHVFSPFAYLVDLLDFLEANWGLDASALEAILLQEILDLECEAGLQPLPQILLAIGVLERLVEPGGGLAGVDWLAAYQKLGDQILQLIGFDRDDDTWHGAHHDLNIAVSASHPRSKTVEQLLAAAREIRRQAVEATNPLPAAPDASAPPLEVEAHEAALLAVQAERASLLAAFDERASKIMGVALAEYRSALLEKAGLTAEDAESRLFIDLRSAPCRLGSRVLQLIQSLQSFVLSVRMGEIEAFRGEGHLQALLDGVDFTAVDEEAWKWLRNYATWASAMYVLLYPENVLMPPLLRQRATPAFRRAHEEMLVAASSARAEAAVTQYEEEVATLTSSALQVIGTFDSYERLVIFATTGHNLHVNVRQHATGRWAGWLEYEDWDEDFRPGSIKRVDPHDHPDSDRAGDFVVWLRKPGQFAGLDASVARDYALVDAGGEVKESYTTPTVSSGDWEDLPDDGETLFTLFESEPFDAQTVRPGGSVGGSPGHVNVAVLESQFEVSESWQVEIDFDPTAEEQAATASGKVDLKHFSVAGRPFSYWLVAVVEDRSMMVGGQNMICARYERSERQGDWQVVSGSLRNVGMPTGYYTGPSAPKPARLFNRSRHDYYVEHRLHLPMMMGWLLNRAGDYDGANAWYRKIYDPFLPEGTRPRIAFDRLFDQPLERPEDWLEFARDPHGVAARRRGAYLRGTVLLMVRNLLDWAEHQFALANVESVNRARELFQMAATILQAPALQNPCDAQRQALEFELLTRFGESAPLALAQVRRLETIEDRRGTLQAVKKLRRTAGESRTATEFASKATAYLDRSPARPAAVRGGGERPRFGDHLARCAGAACGLEDALLATDLGKRLLGGGSQSPTEVPADEQGSPVPRSLWFCVPTNPLLSATAFRAAVGLERIRSCRNATGEPAATPGLAGAEIGGTVFTEIGQLASPDDVVVLTPPRFRFAYLLQQARQQAQLAQQLGSSLLVTIEKRDSARLELLTAEQKSSVGKATVQLKGIAEDAARHGIEIANAQQRRALSQQGFWEERVYQGGPMGMSSLEMAALLATGAMAAVSGIELGFRVGALVGGTIGGLVGGSASAIGGAISTGGPGAIASLPGGGVGAAIGAVAGVALVPVLAAAAATLPTIASYERRHEDWRQQLSLSLYDVEIAESQIGLAVDQFGMSRQEKRIAELEDEHAEAILEFLRNRKFANEALFEVMVDILLDTYRSVMRVATSTALLAQSALEFENQEKVHLVQGDYWSIQREELNAEQKSVGLLGAERLLTDLVRLEDNKLATEKRFHSLRKTISLAAYAPAEFVEFRKTGRITFSTLLDWFDRDFPGHYLRLIRNVELTLVALVPPSDGIHAMLHNDGSSTVEVKRDGLFVTQRGMRAFGESIALDSPFSDSGVSKLHPADHMLLPFEGLGVESTWSLELPRAANRFHFETIMDVYFTIEYSALHDEAKRQQVVQRLGNRQTADVVFSLKANYPDLWYHLHNPGGVSIDEFEIVRHGFPPNLEVEQPLSLKALTVILESGNGGSLPAALLDGFALEKDGQQIAIDAQPESANGLFSTRRSGTAPLPAGIVPEGKWKLVTDDAVRDDGGGARPLDGLADITLVLTVEGSVIW